MYLDCPAYLDDQGAARCGLPAEVKRSYSMDSTDGPLDSVMIRCPAGHWFNGPLEFLTLKMAKTGRGKTFRPRPALRPDESGVRLRGGVGREAAVTGPGT
jgi:hypothetical protein